MRRMTFVFAVLACAFISNIGRADYLIKPSVAATSLFSGSTSTDDSVRQINLGYTLNFFGDPVTSIYVSSNGNLNFIGDTVYTNRVLPAYLQIIAPLWDDHYIIPGAGQKVLYDGFQGGSAVTWDVSQFQDSQPIFKFQVAIFSDPTTIGSFNFLKDDIVFSYELVTPQFYDNDATVGLSYADPNGVQSQRFAPLPGDADGFISDAQAGLLPTGLGDAILFRPNGNNYDVSLINVTPVPEPMSMGMLVAATAGAICTRRWRRKHAETN